MSCMNYACSYEMHTITLELHNQTQAPNGKNKNCTKSAERAVIFVVTSTVILGCITIFSPAQDPLSPKLSHECFRMPFLFNLKMSV